VILLVLLGLSARNAAASLHVEGRHLVDRGRTVRLLGVNRSGTESMCIAGRGRVFDGPHDQRSVTAMRSWRINAVRVPLNESCWLGVGELRRWAATYRRAVVRWVRLLLLNRLYVILDDHVTAAGRGVAKHILPMPSAAQTPRFWRSVARRFRRTRNLIFDLYNEPHEVGWSCWLRGCRIPAGVWFGTSYPRYRAAGMRRLLRAVRSTGAQQPVMLAGIGWSSDLSMWARSAPRDSPRQIIASLHTYGPTGWPSAIPCLTACRQPAARVARRYPVVVGELGQMNCDHDYIDDFMRWADRHGISYLAWSWVAGRWECESGPSLIEKYDGTPTLYGDGFRNHLLLTGLFQRVLFVGDGLGVGNQGPNALWR
jgi:hypothetical protein